MIDKIPDVWGPQLVKRFSKPLPVQFRFAVPPPVSRRRRLWLRILRLLPQPMRKWAAARTLPPEMLEPVRPKGAVITWRKIEPTPYIARVSDYAKEIPKYDDVVLEPKASGKC